MIFEAALWAGFGLIFGSFTNVLILRHGVRSLTGRSACVHCKAQLRWYELVPLLSWLALLGRCGHCGKALSLQYPIVEALTAVGFVGVGLSPLPLVVRLVGCAIIVLCIAIAVYDLRYMIMPDRWVWVFAPLAFLSSVVLIHRLIPEGEFMPYFMLVLAGPVVALPLFAMWFFSRGAWMGFGDVKFALGIGWLLGIGYGYLALLYAFLIGAFVGVFILLPLPRLIRGLRWIGITRLGEGGAGFTMKSEVPFGPFLIVGTCIVWFALMYAYAPILGFPAALVLWN